MFLLRPILLLIESINRLTREVIHLHKVMGLRKPGLVFSKMISEGMNGMSKFVLVLPTPGAPDVANGGSREVVYSINDGAPVTVTPAGNATETEPFDAEEGQVVTGTLVDIDNAGNRSEPRPFNLPLTDTLAPPQPGEVGVRMTEETESPTPEPQP